MRGGETSGDESRRSLSPGVSPPPTGGARPRLAPPTLDEFNA
jgi:hypothetical protein